MKIRILHLYPKLMNIYGDIGNVIALKKRAGWRGIEAEVVNIDIKDKLEVKNGDILFIGGGQDRGQIVVSRDLKSKAQIIKEAIENGTPALTICGGYQLFGAYFLTQDGQKLTGIEVFKAYTKASSKRMIGNVVVESARFGKLIGFENHSGQTMLEASAEALGRVSKGFGNNQFDHREGIIYKNAIGTYLHGSFLPKNPAVADFLISRALISQGLLGKLQPLDDALENQARQVAEKLPQ